MDRWCDATEQDPSFTALFSHLRLPIPKDRTQSTSTKNPSPLEVSISGSPFLGFRGLSIDDLEISGSHTLLWAIHLFDNYGPSPTRPHLVIWDPEVMRSSLREDVIKSEQDTMSYVQVSLLQPALTAAIFIHAQHLGLTPEECGKHPHGDWRLTDCSTTGPNGRGDLGVIRRYDHSSMQDDRFVVACETKTYHVCCSNGNDLNGRHVQVIPVLEYLGRWVDNQEGYIPMDPPGSSSTSRPPGEFHWYPAAWKKKIQKILFQCWHQTVIRKTEHCVLINERQFVLVLRQDHDLLLSKAYSCCPPSPDETCKTLTHLAYFLAHALCRRFPSKDEYNAAPNPPNPFSNPAVVDTTLASSTSFAFQGSLHPHARTDSQATIKGPAPLTIVRYAMSVVRQWGPDPTASSVIFTLAGCSSLPLALNAVNGHPIPYPLSCAKRACAIILSEILHWGDRFHVFHGYCGGKSIVAKITTDCADRSTSCLQAEYAVYQTLHRLQGSAIPRCYGLFRVADFADLLLMEDCGQSLESFDELSMHQRRSLASHVSEIHRHNVCHQDLEPRNILVSESGQLRVADFELSDRFHECRGRDCLELQTFRTCCQDNKGSRISIPRNRHFLLLSALAVGIALMLIVFIRYGGRIM